MTTFGNTQHLKKERSSEGERSNLYHSLRLSGVVGLMKTGGMGQWRGGGRGEIEADGSHDAERTNQQTALSRYGIMAAGHRPI